MFNRHFFENIKASLLIKFRKDNVFYPEVKRWFELVEEVSEERRINSYNLIVDFDVITKLSQNKKDELRYSPDNFLNLFELFCKRIQEVNETHAESVVDSLSSLSKILYMLDSGFEIACKVVLTISDLKLRQRMDVYAYYMLAWMAVKQKRDAILDYINIFETEKALKSLEKEFNK
ncbi:MAG: hypothetical protein ACD_50C00080G0003 [uncultured bacterium]|uniref:Uncharacterized protein n=1 Tax=Candidatus Woesebacteria bacterium RIFCSPLOWO2_01_FULL_39_21 TaxID=1802519 RepID=A0A1F8BBQ1_9BACT|nr:MAG: hypothetical protein ACD_50C00080G0003 [uncultured bacterium]OGM22175.1 MAG: hypothetical protein A2691_01155 [Candidatus Woesebacteria bacterium RIFCSPHIGHO2_01_FULL_39_23]OGM61487.1 MAG: hypothetical protein A2961_00595 [Candidatus Woesebacteria bacterium RIFCSPLOWO2_01_FULL_39_21]